MIKIALFRAGTPAAVPEACVIEVRGPEGQLIRKITQFEADRVVESGLGFRRGKHEVRLLPAVVHHDGNPRTWLGSQRDGRIRPSNYAHNQRVCDAWRDKQQNRPKAQEDNS